MIGLDTGFFVELMNGNEEAVSLLKSCLSILLGSPKTDENYSSSNPLQSANSR